MTPLRETLAILLPEASPQVIKRVIERHTSGFPIRQDCVVSDDDYERGSKVDRAFIKRHKLQLLQLFDCKCAVCGANDNGCDIDHYFVPKAKGGNFVLRTIDGRALLNAVPMCETCNRSKGKNAPVPTQEILDKMCTFQKQTDLSWVFSTEDAEGAK